MCGIAGFMLKGDKPIHENHLACMGKELTHRGPDNFSFVIRERAGFAHTRLSIIDVSEAGNQPFQNSRYVLCYNGEIYNYLDLKKHLIKDGVRFKSKSDTEVLFYYLIKKGVLETLKVIKGMFAFSFYDSVKKRLYLCRDRFGIKPLNWILTGDGLYWASEVKALKGLMSIEPDPIKTLFSITGKGEWSCENTMFKDVKQVIPGTFLKYESGKAPEIHIYFDVLELIDKNYYGELNSYDMKSIINVFAKLFDNSVKSMLMSDVPMGIFVSGGIDSSLISSFATRHKERIKFFTANIMGPFSEYLDTKLLADSIGARLYDYKFEPQMMLRDWTKTTYYYECPIVFVTNAIPFFNVSWLAKEKKVKPILTGEGADELFLGYPEPLYENYFGFLKFPVELLKKIYNVVPGLRRKLYPEPSQYLPNFIFNLSHRYENQILKPKTYDAFGFLHKKDIKYQSLTIEMMRSRLIGLLYRNDRMGMMASIESRFPYLDEDLVKFAINLPHKWKLCKTTRLHDIYHPYIVDKYILRKLAEGRLPNKLVNKRKWRFEMHGHKNVIVRNGCFQGGYIQNLLGLSKKDEEQLLQREDPYFIAKLVSIDIFGRLYAIKQKQEEVDEHVHNYVTIQVKSTWQNHLFPWA